MAERNTLPTVTAKNYFEPDIEMAYMGSTQVKNFMRCEAAELARERKLQEAMLGVKNKFGKNAILKGTNLVDGATAADRNSRIGGHKA